MPVVVVVAVVAVVLVSACLFACLDRQILSNEFRFEQHLRVYLIFMSRQRRKIPPLLVPLPKIYNTKRRDIT